MSKKIKLKLDDLNVQSFVTSAKDNEKLKGKGGGPSKEAGCTQTCSRHTDWCNCCIAY